MKRSDFNFELPQEFIAQKPLHERSQSKLLVLHRETGVCEDSQFYSLEKYLQKNDLLVVNNTRVIPARLFAKKETGGTVEVFLLREIEDGVWDVLMRPSGRVKKGARLEFQPDFSCSVLDEPHQEVTRRIQFSPCADVWDRIERIGRMPLPQYIKHTPNEEDSVRYQTVFASERGAVAAPTAGLHFTEELIERLREKGIEFTSVTLHVGYGTFKPVTVDSLAEHRMHEEYYEVSAESAEAINRAKKDGRRIVACGTTSVRVLETATDSSGMVHSGSGMTSIFIYPPYTFKSVDALITNFHLPESTLLMLVAAFAGREHILAAYEYAKQHQYRFYSYGDAMFIY